MSKKREARGTNDERRQQRHSVHSAWYREFQKGGEIPSTGLATGKCYPLLALSRPASTQQGPKTIYFVYLLRHSALKDDPKIACIFRYLH